MTKEQKKDMVNKLARLSYWFSNEMIKDEEQAKKEKEECEKALQSGKQVMVVLTAEGNAKCMKECLKDTNAIINFLREKDNAEYIEEWQIAGVNAMFDKCNAENIIPFDLPAAIMGILGMWDELKKALA